MHIWKLPTGEGNLLNLKGGESVVCPLVVLDEKLEYKLQALEKHMRICQQLKVDILKLQDEKKFAYFDLMGGKGVY